MPLLLQASSIFYNFAVMNNPFDYTPDASCDAAFHRLTARLEKLRASNDPADLRFLSELEAGKMLGVLIARDVSGMRHTLYAFSGQLGDGGFNYPGFVGPVFDYLLPGGYFKTHEAAISRQNGEIARFESETLRRVRGEYDRAADAMKAEIAGYKTKCRLSKLERDSRRKEGGVDEKELGAMTRQSQFEKAELHRLKKRLAAELAPLEERLREADARLEAMREKRRADSEALQQWLADNFKVLNARGESRSLSEIFAGTVMKNPPSGAGECCAPKLLQAAYLRGLAPLAMAEYWYGKPKDGEVRIHGHHYPACRGKCRPVLGWMLQGLDVTPPLDSLSLPEQKEYQPEVVYENRWFCVVDKPSGMLSVLGRSAAVSVQQWLSGRYGADRDVRMVHRLDQDTSGLLIAAFGQETYKILQSLFAMRKIRKTYVADLEGDYSARGMSRKGRIELPLAPDWLDRPRQRVALADGKEAVTDYEFTDVTEDRSRVLFYPHTGRTHQLRVHAASVRGLGMPIAGDRLYGDKSGRSVTRLHLHAHKIEFTFPLDGQDYSFESPVPF